MYNSIPLHWSYSVYNFITSFTEIYIDLTKYSTPKQSTEYWIQNLHLYPADKQILLGEGWLTDSIINAGQYLLKRSHPHVGGLQPTALGETLAFSVASTEFAQILNVAGNHWITVSNFGCPPGHINVYDSIPACDIPKHTKRQIAAILHTSETEITLNFQKVQIQKGANDCGLFALAFAATLCDGENPSEINYIQHELRKHLLMSIEKGSLLKFPQRKRKKKPRLLFKSSFGIFCHCRLPASGKMIECTTCQQWYHKYCVKAPSAAWKKKTFLWSCDSCSKVVMWFLVMYSWFSFTYTCVFLVLCYYMCYFNYTRIIIIIKNNFLGTTPTYESST